MHDTNTSAQKWKSIINPSIHSQKKEGEWADFMCRNKSFSVGFFFYLKKSKTAPLFSNPQLLHDVIKINSLYHGVPPPNKQF